MQLRTPSAVHHPSPTLNHHTYVELHLRPTAQLRWLLHLMEAIAAVATAAASSRSCSSNKSSSSSNGSSDGDSTSPAILLPYLAKPRSLAAAVGFAFRLTTQTRRPINTTFHQNSSKTRSHNRLFLLFTHIFLDPQD